MNEYKVTITYERNGIGPYAAVFSDQNEALKWIGENDINILAIDFV